MRKLITGIVCAVGLAVGSLSALARDPEPIESVMWEVGPLALGTTPLSLADSRLSIVAWTARHRQLGDTWTLVTFALLDIEKGDSWHQVWVARRLHESRKDIFTTSYADGRTCAALARVPDALEALVIRPVTMDRPRSGEDGRIVTIQTDGLDYLAGIREDHDNTPSSRQLTLADRGEAIGPVFDAMEADLASCWQAAKPQ